MGWATDLIQVLLSCGDNGEHTGRKVTLARTLADKVSFTHIKAEGL